MGYKISVLLWGSLETIDMKMMSHIQINQKSVLHGYHPLSSFFGRSLQIIQENLLSFNCRRKSVRQCPLLLYSLFKKCLTDSVILACMSFHHSLCSFLSWYDELLAYKWDLQMGQDNSVKGSCG